MNREVVIIGGGGHAKVLIDILSLKNRTVSGIIEQSGKSDSESVLGIRVLGCDEELEKQDPNSIELVNGVGSASNSEKRRELYESFKQKGFFFGNVIHPSSTVSQSASLGEGVQILGNALVGPMSSIGENTIINSSASVDHACQIASHVHLAPGCVLCGDVCVDSGAFIGAGAVILPGCRIGKEALVAAGAVVTRNVEAKLAVRGIPASAFPKQSSSGS